MSSALKASGGAPNPLAVMAAVQNAPGMQKIVMKYAMDPEFLKTTMEMANDPALKSAASTMGVNMPAMQPGAMPQLPRGQAQPGDEDGDGEMTFDPSAISGAQPAAQPRPAAGKKVPSPVDNGQ